MRIGVEPAAGVGHADQLEQFVSAGAGLAAAEIGVGGQNLGDLLLDRGHRVQRAHRVLEDHADLLSPDVEHGLLAHRHDVAAVELDGATDDARRWIGKQAHDRQRRQRLAAA